MVAGKETDWCNPPSDPAMVRVWVRVRVRVRARARARARARLRDRVRVRVRVRDRDRVRLRDRVGRVRVRVGEVPRGADLLYARLGLGLGLGADLLDARTGGDGPRGVGARRVEPG